MARKTWTVLLAVALAIGLAGCANWPMFHGDPLRSGVSSDSALGASHAPNLSLRWKTFISEFVESSPAIVYNSNIRKTLVYTSNEGFGISGSSQVDAIDLATGSVVWTASVSGAVYSSPAVVGNTVYFGTALFPTTSNHGELVALNATTGAVQCTFMANGLIFDAPVVGSVDNTGPVVYFGDAGISEDENAGHEWAVNGVGNSAGSCTRKWVFNGWNNTASGTRTGSWAPPALATDSTGRPLVVFGSSDPDDSVYALDARTGTKVWRFQTLAQSDTDVGAAPTISPPGTNGFAHGVVYIDGKDGIEYALDLLTGAQIWSFDLRAHSGGVAVDSEQATAAFTGDRVVVPYAGFVYSLDPRTGTQMWRSPAAGGDFNSSPVVTGSGSDRAVLIGDDASVEHAYRLTDGVPLFAYTTGGPILSSVGVGNGTAVFGSDDGYLYALH